MSVSILLCSGSDGSSDGDQARLDRVFAAAWWEAFIVALPSALAAGEGPLGAAAIADAAVVQFRRVISGCEIEPGPEGVAY